MARLIEDGERAASRVAGLLWSLLGQGTLFDHQIAIAGPVTALRDSRCNVPVFSKIDR
jgi:hypothetical protein